MNDIQGQDNIVNLRVRLEREQWYNYNNDGFEARLDSVSIRGFEVMGQELNDPRGRHPDPAELDSALFPAKPVGS